MRLLDRYLFREFIIPFAYCLSGFLIFWIVFNLFQQLGMFQDGHLKGKEVLLYYFLITPEMLSLVLPIALLLALLYALTNHARHHELTAIRAAGISLWRLALPYLLVGFVSSVGLFFIDEFVAPESAERAEAILKKRTPNLLEKLYFRNEREKRIWNIASYNLKTHQMIQPNVTWRLPDGTFREVHAETGVFTNGVWQLFNVQELHFKTEGDLFPVRIVTNTVTLSFAETPELIRSETIISTMNPKKAARRARIPIRDILNYLQLHPELSATQSANIHTQFHARLAAPWTCLVVVLIALPFGAPSGRRNVFVGVAASIVICFGYFVLQQLSLSLGMGGKLPPVLAAWLPNLIFGGTGIFLTSNIR
ncbi:MAG: putative permease YjgP/YjgQ family protein [Verrucomicrobiales bacterium]|nr:putative permease YjgP/YjgQ family protein [Verrucomicrobiales bacterium]